MNRRAPRYLTTPAAHHAIMSDYRPTERLILLALRLAHHEQPDGITKRQLREQVGGAESTFNEAWRHLVKQGLVINAVALTRRGRDVAEHDMNLADTPTT